MSKRVLKKPKSTSSKRQKHNYVPIHYLLPNDLDDYEENVEYYRKIWNSSLDPSELKEFLSDGIPKSIQRTASVLIISSVVPIQLDGCFPSEQLAMLTPEDVLLVAQHAPADVIYEIYRIKKDQQLSEKLLKSSFEKGCPEAEIELGLKILYSNYKKGTEHIKNGVARIDHAPSDKFVYAVYGELLDPFNFDNCLIPKHFEFLGLKMDTILPNTVLKLCTMAVIFCIKRLIKIDLPLLCTEQIISYIYYNDYYDFDDTSSTLKKKFLSIPCIKLRHQEIREIVKDFENKKFFQF